MSWTRVLCYVDLCCVAICCVVVACVMLSCLMLGLALALAKPLPVLTLDFSNPHFCKITFYSKLTLTLNLTNHEPELEPKP
jgi:hypothetical protein